MSKTTQEMIDIMQDYQDGELVEFQSNYDRSWRPALCPNWNWELLSYRIKNKHEFMDSDVIDAEVFNNDSDKLQVESKFTTINYNKADLEYMISLLGEK